LSSENKNIIKPENNQLLIKAAEDLKAQAKVL
jgi:hypothetical protein